MLNLLDILMKKIINEMEIFMAVIRVAKTDNYTVMSNHHLRNKNISLKAKGLMSLMLSLPPSWDYSIGGLAAICKESHTSIRSALKELEQNQYLIRERKNNKKGYFTYEYTLYEVPSPHAGKQHTDSAYADKQYTEEVHTVSNRQINKDELIKDELNKEKIKKDKTNTTKPKSKIKTNRISSYDEILNSLVTNESLKELYKDFIESREAMEAPITRQGLKVLIDRCEKLSNHNVRIQKLLLETALVNGWKNVFLPSETHQEEAKQEAMNELKEFYGGGMFEND
jgi:predicted transcriptional regulator